MNDLDHIYAPKIQKSKLGVKKLEGIDIKWSNPYGTKLHILLATLKALILKTPPTSVKKQEPHLMQDLLCVSFANKKKT